VPALFHPLRHPGDGRIRIGQSKKKQTHMIALLPPLPLPRRPASRTANSMQWPLLCKCEGPTPPRGDAKKD
jgi:hypothetical protein